MTRKTVKGRGGFILLEVIPSLLLLSTIFLILLRTLCWQASVRERIDQQKLAADEFAQVWLKWLESGGRAAMVRRFPDGRREILEFPDDTWLPDPAEFTDQRNILWRRRHRDWSAAPDCWLIEFRVGRMRDWRWWTTICTDPWGSVGVDSP